MVPFGTNLVIVIKTKAPYSMPNLHFIGAKNVQIYYSIHILVGW